jgi:hypothetical protein
MLKQGISMNLIQAFKGKHESLKKVTLEEAMLYASESDLDLLFEALYNIALENDNSANLDGVQLFDLDKAVKTIV